MGGNVFLFALVEENDVLILNPATLGSTDQM